MELCCSAARGLTPRSNWQAKGKAAGGFVHFMDKGGKLDPVWVRRVCQSIRFSGKVYPDNMSKKNAPPFEVLPK